MFVEDFRALLSPKTTDKVVVALFQNKGDCLDQGRILRGLLWRPRAKEGHLDNRLNHCMQNKLSQIVDTTALLR